LTWTDDRLPLATLITAITATLIDPSRPATDRPHGLLALVAPPDQVAIR
jgi:hypothetical protein